jgi:hypothetical protein
VVPSREDITSNLPLAWSDPHLHAYLPKSALALLRKQQSKFTRDWAAIQQAPAPLNTITRPDYLYTWLLANTRTFYVSNHWSYLDPLHDCLGSHCAPQLIPRRPPPPPKKKT